jgi:flap endonuclease-1
MVHPEKIRLEPGLQKLGISREQLVDIAILVGTDFNDGVKGFGPKKSLKLLIEKGSLDHAFDSLTEGDVHISPEELSVVRHIFLEPTITKDYSLQWRTPDSPEVIRLLCDEHQFSKDRVKPVLEQFSFVHQPTTQKNLFDFS